MCYSEPFQHPNDLINVLFFWYAFVKILGKQVELMRLTAAAKDFRRLVSTMSLAAFMFYATQAATLMFKLFSTFATAARQTSLTYAAVCAAGMTTKKTVISPF